jgi:Rps23 Pro-64 3,4-dihydroxylase Tpa1-like proline 4-hydroxylase
MNGLELTKLKTDLFTNGFISFNIKDVDTELYNELEIAIPPNSLNPNEFTNLRNSIVNPFNNPAPEFESDILNTSFDELEILKNKIIKNYSFETGYGLDQIWFYQHITSDKILDFRYKLYSLFYNINTGNCGTQLSLYNDGCFLRNHQDGYSDDRHCAMLLYLSTDWEDGKGGELVIDDTSIVPPIYGNVAILDFTKHNPYHMVNPVKGFNRYCLLNFCNPTI